MGYPGVLEEILDPAEYTEKLCSCNAIITTRFHGAILGLHMGVPTFGAFHHPSDNKVPDLMIETMSLPDQFFHINQNLTREIVDRQVAAVQLLYEEDDRRDAIHAQLSQLNEEFHVHARHVLLDLVGMEERKQQPQQLQQEEKRPLTQLRLVIATGEDYVVAMLLLLVIVGLALLPSTGKSSGNRRQRPSKDEGMEQVKKVGANGAQEASIGHSCVQKENDTRGPSTTVTRLGSTCRDCDEGLLEDQSKATSMISSSHTPHQVLSNGNGKSTTASENKLSEVIFVVNFILWIALAVTYSSYSKFYLRNTHDPVGLLVLQGTTGAVALLFLGFLGLGSSNPSLSSFAGQPTSSGQRAMAAAVLHASQALLTNFSLFVGGVALTNALKAMEPVAAAVFSYLLLGKTASPASVVSFATIVVGILLLTSKGNGGGSSKAVPVAEGGGIVEEVGNGGHYSRILVSAVFTIAAVSCNALRNVLIKKSAPVPPQQTLFSCSVAAGVVGVALMLVRLTMRSMDNLLLGQEDTAASMVAAQRGEATAGLDATHSSFEDQYDTWLNVDGVNAALCFVGYNFASFNLLARLSPVGHAVGNSVKRVIMFASGMLLLGEVLTSRQLTGAVVALLGVMIYNVTRTRK